MLRGLYIAAMGMQVQMNRQENISNNLANVDTAGFKQETVTFRSNFHGFISRINDEKVKTTKGTFPAIQPVGPTVHGAVVDGNHIDFSMGRLKTTGNALDMALDKDGYFTVATPGRGVLYTRNGSFLIDSDGVLVNQDGFQVLGKDGPINILKKRLTPEVAAAYEDGGQKVERDDQGAYLVRKGPVTVDRDGKLYMDGETIGELVLVNLPKESTSKVGYAYFASSAAPTQTSAKVHQGILEESNVSVVKEMVSMIEAFRAYEFSAKVLQSQDDLLGRAVSEVGRSSR